MPQRRDVFYGNDPEWGSYSLSGDLIEQAALRSGADLALVGQQLKSTFHVEDLSLADDDEYIYGGVFNPHYGHFICTTLSRMWYLLERPNPKAKVILHASCGVDEIFSLDFARTCFHRIGLTRERLEVFSSPHRVRGLVIPEPAFREQSDAHVKFREMCLHIGSPFIDDSDRQLGPVYLSKSRLRMGVGRFVNEVELEVDLQSRGVEIVYPEELTFEDQIHLFSQRRVIAGMAGSAFHTGVFAPSHGGRIELAGYNIVNSNHVIIDDLVGALPDYVYPSDPSKVESNLDEFLTSMTLADVRLVGSDLAELIHEYALDAKDVYGEPSNAENQSSHRGSRVADCSSMEGGLDKLHFATRNTLKPQIDRHGWLVGPHTYGTPLIMDEPYGQLTIGSFCSISMNVTIALSNHRTDTVSSYPFLALAGLWPGAERASPDHEDRGGVVIGNDVWIGVGAVILAGARIGTGCVIGANAVVSGHVPDYAIVAGNPGRIIRKRFDEETVARLLATQWWDWDEAMLTKMMPWLASGDPRRFLRAVERHFRRPSGPFQPS